MRIYDGVASIDDAMRGAVLSVGNFDGVHLGHQRILRTAHALAQVSSSAVLVMTFEPHPLAILRPEHAPQRLTPWAEKVRQLEHAGVHAVVRLPADRSVLSLTAEDFVREVLVKRIHPSYIVEGPDFGFGRDRAGHVELLAQMAGKGGYQLHVAEPYRLCLAGGEHVIASSTVIRKLLVDGRVDDAAACLGRPYTLVGKVVHGAAAGRHLGFPTINLDVGEQLVPADGVYAGIAELADARCTGWCENPFQCWCENPFSHPPLRESLPAHLPGKTGVAATHRPRAAISIGNRPTLGGNARVIEAFILDETGDWYDLPARLDLIARLRDQIKFPSRQALTDQIAQDVAAIRRIIPTT